MNLSSSKSTKQLSIISKFPVKYSLSTMQLNQKSKTIRNKISIYIYMPIKNTILSDSYDLLLLLSHFSRIRLCATPQTAVPRPWDSPGKNTGVGCHFLLQCMKVKSEREVTQSCLTLSDPMECSLPGSSVHGIFQARVLEQGVITFSVHMTQENSKQEILLI